MSLAVILRHGLRLLVPLAVASTLYLYLYPVFLGCAFPLPATARHGSTGKDSSSPVGETVGETADDWSAFFEAARQHLLPLPVPSPTGARPAPFRLLALGDPQLEGDTSIPNLTGPRLPHLTRAIERLTSKTSPDSLPDRVRHALHDWVDFLFEDIPTEVGSLRKRIDLFGNDFYLAHIYRTVHWWTKPTHVAVLGDLVGSQWIKNDEFDRRGRRYWHRVFRGAERVPDRLAAYPAMEYELSAYLDDEDAATARWSRRVINVAGNHDIGYAGDINRERFDRFERVFGKANYELRFELPVRDPAVNATLFDGKAKTNLESERLAPELRVVVLNSMNLDTPASDARLQDATYAFVNDVIRTSAAVEFDGTFTLVLTHIPLHKPAGVCVDAPYFSFHPARSGGVGGGGVKEQNQLSADATRGFLEGIFGMSGDPDARGRGRGRPGVILNGHDHEGCDSYHFIRQAKDDDDGNSRSWEAARWPDAVTNGTVGRDDVPGVREITVRSMMGDFGGNAGLLSAWFDEESWSWKFEYATCALGKQHFWWVVHVLDLVTVAVAIAYAVLTRLAGGGREQNAGGKGSQGGSRSATRSPSQTFGGTGLKGTLNGTLNGKTASVGKEAELAKTP
ncbi:hypothetical protein SODALDRAFT_331769 [Sodiomyces alkalinus F11]|uniref:Calcineurin-like phosphoesterase domain-containing protein n=1 Tax=Sodiomyces alkalinus (strain CBS 110278 / VKM F-3762 / F11) TaxID=1314773 RepID=A0A3N2PYQ6_SODAK|nr:hypothetical protein SODALDRAFT_331769 [Sodiomyces alkalinus F11]ROT39659.1 hypothetical protein SODALDRAFT_331769 [Sodiomyces alkalinus F11]